MNWQTVQIIILSFGIGLMLGTLLSYFFMRRVINKKIKSLSFHITQLKAHKDYTALKIETRKENLLLLADKLRKIENSLEKLRQKEYDTYINSLNLLLDQKGISRIEDND